MTNQQLVEACVRCLKASGDTDENVNKLSQWANSKGIDSDRLGEAFKCAEFIIQQ